MRRFTRVLSGAWLLWFTTTLVESPVTRICPLHGSHVAGVSHDAHAAGTHADHHARHTASPQPTKNVDTCSCPDACRCGTPALLAPISAARLHDAIVVTRAVAFDLAAAASCVPRAHALPFANGPPVL